MTENRAPYSGKRPNNGYPPTMVSKTFYLEMTLERRLRMQAALEKIQQAEIVRVAIEAELNRRGG